MSLLQMTHYGPRIDDYGLRSVATTIARLKSQTLRATGAVNGYCSSGTVFSFSSKKHSCCHLNCNSKESHNNND